MKTIKVMSIIGIVWFSISLICVVGFEGSVDAPLASSGWGILGMLYAIPYSIVCLVHSMRKNGNSLTEEDIKWLKEQKAKGDVQ